MARMTRIEWVKVSSTRFEAVPAELPELPTFLQLPPSTFGLSTSIELNEQHAPGEVLWVSDTPYAKAKRASETVITARMDSCYLEGKPGIFNRQNGKMEADPIRLDALRDYYAKQRTEDSNGNDFYAEDCNSPFGITEEQIVNRLAQSAVGKFFTEFKPSEEE